MYCYKIEYVHYVVTVISQMNFIKFLPEPSFRARGNVIYNISVSLSQVRSEFITCTFRASYCSARLSRTQVPNTCAVL